MVTMITSAGHQWSGFQLVTAEPLNYQWNSATEMMNHHWMMNVCQHGPCSSPSPWLHLFGEWLTHLQWPFQQQLMPRLCSWPNPQAVQSQWVGSLVHSLAAGSCTMSHHFSFEIVKRSPAHFSKARWESSSSAVRFVPRSSRASPFLESHWRPPAECHSPSEQQWI